MIYTNTLVARKLPVPSLFFSSGKRVEPQEVSATSTIKRERELVIGCTPGVTHDSLDFHFFVRLMIVVPVQHGGVCGNPEGVYAFSSTTVRSYRQPFVTAKHAPGRDKKHSRSDSMCSDH